MADTLHRATISLDTGQASASIGRLVNAIELMSATVMAIASKMGADLSGVARAAFQATTEAAGGAGEAAGAAIEGAGERGRGALDSLGDNAGRNGSRIQRSLDTITLSAVLDQIDRVGRGLNSLAGEGMNFEQSMADLSAITGTAGHELEELSNTARQVGRESGLGASESARAFTILASQIQVPIEELKELQQQTVLLSQAGGISLETAANAIAGTINQYQMSSDQAARVTNVLAAGARAGAAEVNDLAESFKVVGALANNAGVSVEETASAIEILSKSNIKGAEAGTALRNVLLAMPTKLNINVADTGFAGALQMTKEYLDGIASPTERAAKMAQIFGRESITAAQYLMSNVEALDAMTVAVTGTNEAQEQAAIRNNTSVHAIDLLDAKIKDIKISINEALGGSFLPMTAAVADQAVQVSLLLPLLSVAQKAIVGLASSQKIAAIAQQALNFAMSANPIGIIVIAIAALVTGIVLAYKHCDEFREGVNKVWVVIKQVGADIWALFKPAFEEIGKIAAALWPVLKFLGGVLIDALLLPIRLLGSIIGWLADGFGAFWKILKAGHVLLWEWLKPAFDALSNVIQTVWGHIKTLGGIIIDFLIEPIKAAIKFIDTAIDKVKDLLGIKAAESAVAKSLDDERMAAEAQSKTLDGLGDRLKTLQEQREALIKQGEDVQEVDRKIAAAQSELVAKQESEAPRIAAAIDTVTERLRRLNIERDRLIAAGTPLSGLEAQIASANQQLEAYQLKLAEITKKEEEGKKKPKLGHVVDEEGDKKIRNLYSIEGLSNIINDLQEKASLSAEREAVALMKKAHELEKIKKAMEVRITNAAEEDTSLERIAKIKEHIASLQETIQRATKEAGKSFSQELDKLFGELEELRNKVKTPIITPIILAKPIYKEDIAAIVKKDAEKHSADKLFGLDIGFNTNKEDDKRKDELEDKKNRWKDYVGSIQSGVGAIGESMSNLGSIIGAGAGDWLQWGAGVISAIGQAIPALLALFNAQTAVAGSGAASSSAGIPIVGPAIAVAAVTSILAAIASIPKASAFAAGGIVSGPTYALVGEYAGASNNPEVIAPLNKLRDLIRPAATDSRGLEANVEFKIRGRDLIGLIKREKQINKLS